MVFHVRVPTTFWKKTLFGFNFGSLQEALGPTILSRPETPISRMELARSIHHFRGGTLTKPAYCPQTSTKTQVTTVVLQGLDFQFSPVTLYSSLDAGTSLYASQTYARKARVDATMAAADEVCRTNRLVKSGNLWLFSKQTCFPNSC